MQDINLRLISTGFQKKPLLPTVLVIVKARIEKRCTLTSICGVERFLLRSCLIQTLVIYHDVRFVDIRIVLETISVTIFFDFIVKLRRRRGRL